MTLNNNLLRKANLEDIKLAYQTFLQREVESESVAENLLKNKPRVIDILKSITNSQEFSQAKVQRSFPNYLTKENKDTLKQLPKIIFFGAYGNGNLGDMIQANALARLFMSFGYKADELAAVSWINVTDYDFVGTRLTPSSIWSFELLASAELLVIGGGGLFDAVHYPLETVEWIECLIEYKIPYALLGVGVAQGYLKIHPKSLKLLVENAVFNSGRDTPSLENLLKLDQTAKFVADPVLYSLLTQPVFTQPIKEDRVSIVLKYPHTESDQKFIEKCKLIVNKNPKYDVIFLQTGLGAEDKTAQQFPNAIIAQDEISLLNILKKSKYCISMRYHGCILALAAGCITFGLSQEKIGFLFNKIGLSQHYFSNPEIDLINLMQKDKLEPLQQPNYVELIQETKNNLDALMSNIKLANQFRV